MLERLDFGERGGLVDGGCWCDLEGGGCVDCVDGGEIQLEIEFIELNVGEVGEVDS